MRNPLTDLVTLPDLLSWFAVATPSLAVGLLGAATMMPDAASGGGW